VQPFCQVLASDLIVRVRECFRKRVVSESAISHVAHALDVVWEAIPIAVD
jgi:hypothetical protein